MKIIRTTILSLLLMKMMLLITSYKAISHEEVKRNDTPVTYIKIWVDGLACPFCAYGLEKKIKKLDGVKDMFIEINEGYITFNVPASKKPTEVALQKLVKEAGFNARDITYSKTPFLKNDTK